MSKHALHVHAKPCAEWKRHTRARAVSVKPCAERKRHTRARAVSVNPCAERKRHTRARAVSVIPCAERKRHTRARAVSVNPCACAACLTADTPRQATHQKDGQAACSRRLPVLGVCRYSPVFRRSTRKLPTFTFFSSTDVAYYMPCYP